MFKSNYAANQKRYRISYINTFKDIFLIILFFFSDNILRRNLINTLRETWVRHANVPGARERSSHHHGRRQAVPSSPGDRVRLPAGQAGHGLDRGEEETSPEMTNKKALGLPLFLLPPPLHSFSHSFIQPSTLCPPTMGHPGLNAGAPGMNRA